MFQDEFSTHISRPIPAGIRKNTQVTYDIQSDENAGNPHFRRKIRRRSSQGMVAIVIQQRSSMTDIDIQDSLHSLLTASGYECIHLVTGCTQNQCRRIFRQLAMLELNGIIHMLEDAGGVDIEELCSPTPVVSLQNMEDHYLHVDHTAATFAALEHLWRLGHRNISLLTDGYGASENLIEDYLLFLRQKGQALNPHYLRSGSGDLSGGFFAAKQLALSGATACLACNPLMAAGIYQWAYTNKLRIPDDLSVIGYGQSSLTSAVSPQMTSIEQPSDEIAMFVVERLLAMINQKTQHPVSCKVTPQLILRQSTGSAPQS